MDPSMGLSPQQQMGIELLSLCREVTADSTPGGLGYKDEIVGKIGEAGVVAISRRIGEMYFITIRDEAGQVSNTIVKAKSTKDGAGLERVPENIEIVRDAVRELRDALAAPDESS